MGVTVSRRGHVAEVEADYPPVNALPVRGWFDLADALRATGADAGVHAVVMAAAGRGFNAGVEPSAYRQRVDRRVVHLHFGHVAAPGHRHTHGHPPAKRLLGYRNGPGPPTQTPACVVRRVGTGDTIVPGTAQVRSPARCVRGWLEWQGTYG